jgi:uncharacterized RDD family membrane protein YckC
MRVRNLVVDSVTGVELSLPLAGPGARCYAFLIDWLIRTILFTAWYSAAALIYNRRWSLSAPLSPDAKWFVLVVAPAAAIYFLYHVALEIAMHGRTPGKRIASIHIVTRDGSPPSVSALLTRNVFRLVDSLPIAYGVGLVATLVTKDCVRIGDMAAGTLLAYDRANVMLPEHAQPAETGGTQQQRGLATHEVEIADDLLSRWDTLDTVIRHELAIELLSRYGVSITAELQTDAALKARLRDLSQGARHEQAQS